jgi:PKD repeat protein
LTVTFTNQSTGDYASSWWNFGDGSHSVTQNPTHTFDSAGVYTVSLQISGPGGVDTLTRTNYITVTELLPVADFVASPLSGTLPLTVFFTDTSTGVITGWLWQFGDGLTGTLPSPTHTYNDSGVFTVTLNVAGPGGSDVETKVGYIRARKQYAVYLPIVIK